MIEYRFLLEVNDDYDEYVTELRFNNLYAARMAVAPQLRYIPPRDGYSYRRRESVNTSMTFMWLQLPTQVTVPHPRTGEPVNVDVIPNPPPTPDPNEVIHVDPVSARWVLEHPFDRAWLFDWVTHTAQRWTIKGGWEERIRLADYVLETRAR